VATASGHPFDVDLLDSSEDASFRIYFCGRPARSTGIVNLYLLLGDHRCVLTEKRRVKDGYDGSSSNRGGSREKRERADAEGSSTTEDGETGNPATAEHEKASPRSIYRMCSSDGLPPGCYRVKHDRHYWVMRVGDGTPAEQMPSPRATEEQVVPPSLPSTAASQPHAQCQRDEHGTGTGTDGKRTKSSEAPALSDKHRKAHDKEENKEKKKRKRTHAAVAEEAAPVLVPSRAADNEERGHDGDGDAPLADVVKAFAAAPPSSEATAEVTDDVVGDVESTLGELFLSTSSAVAASVAPVSQATAEVVGPVDVAAPSSTQMKIKERSDAPQTNESDESRAEASRRPQRRRGRGPAAEVEEPHENPPADDFGVTPKVRVSNRSSERSETDATGSNTTAAERRRGKRERKEAVAQKVSQRPLPPQKQQKKEVPPLTPSGPAAPSTTTRPDATDLSCPDAAPSPNPPSAAEAAHGSTQDTSARTRQPPNRSPSPPSSSLADSPPPRLATPPPLPAPPVTLQKQSTETKSAATRPAREEPTSFVVSPREEEVGEERGQRRQTAALPATPKVPSSSSPPPSRKSRRAEAVAAALRTPTRSPPTAPSPDIAAAAAVHPALRTEMPSPTRPPLSPRVVPPLPPRAPAADNETHHPHHSSSEATPLHQQRTGSPDDGTTTSPSLLYSNRSSGFVASPQQPHAPPTTTIELPPPPPPPTALRSASSSTRLAPLTSPHLRQHQQQFPSHRGSSGTGHGGSLPYSDVGSYNMAPQDSPALGFTQVHNTLAEEFSLDPSESGSSSTVSEYLDDVEG
jgi:hypothetical protein